MSDFSKVYLTREHIINHIKSHAGNLMDAFSIIEDSIVFTDYVSEEIKDAKGRNTGVYANNMTDIKEKWFKYSRMVFKGALDFIEFEYKHPYNSKQLSKVCEVSVYIKGEFVYAKEFSDKLTAEAQAYIHEYSKVSLMTPKDLAETMNKILEKELKAYNYITGDNAKFINNRKWLDVETTKFDFWFPLTLLQNLAKDEVLRAKKIDSVLI